jgi:hypothetical protein
MGTTAAGRPSAQPEAGTGTKSQTFLLLRQAVATLRQAFATLRQAFWRACWVREDELTAKESASTLFRFFRSEQIIDLRLIATLALILFVIHLGVVLAFSVVNPLIYFFFHLSNLQFTLTGALNVVSRFLDALTGSTLRSLVLYFGPAIPIYGAIVAWAYLSAATRLGVVDLFACEISTLCRVGTIFDVGKKYAEMYHGKGSAADKHAAAKHHEAKHAMPEQPSQSFTSSENYFPIFDNNSSDLQSLQALVVGYITEYYTYMKAARDLQRKLASIDPAQMSRLSESAPNGSFHSDEWHETLVNIIYVLFLGYESARKSINDLIEFQPFRAENTIIILLTELACYSFLCEYHKDSEIRLKDLERHELTTGGKDALKFKRLCEEFEVKFKRLELRAAKYEELVHALIAKVKEEHGESENYWLPAKRTVTQLQNRFDAATEVLERCRAKDAAAAAAV